MLTDHRKFLNGRDTESVPSFILSLAQTAKFNNNFLGGEELRIGLQPTDGYALFLPEGGHNFFISGIRPFPVIPSQGTGLDMVEVEIVQNPAIINLAESGFKFSTGGNDEFFILSNEAQVITVLIFGGPHS